MMQCVRKFGVVGKVLWDCLSNSEIGEFRRFTGTVIGLVRFSGVSRVSNDSYGWD